MVDILLIILAFIALTIGIIGCIVPAIPGPPISFIGILIMQATDKVDFDNSLLWTLFAVTLFITIIDYVLPSWIVKKTNGSRYAKIGALLGLVVGVFVFPPLGIIFGSLVGAFIGELIHSNNVSQASKSGIAAFVGFIFGTVLKLAVSIYMLWIAIAQLL